MFLFMKQDAAGDAVAKGQRAGRVPRGLWKGVVRRDRGACVYCGCRKGLSVDHVLPRADGGQNVPSNLLTSCLRCNKLRHRCPMRYWIQWCEDLGFGTAATVSMRIVLALAAPIPPAPKKLKRKRTR